MTAPRTSRPPITVPPEYGRGSGGKRMKTLRGPDGGRDRGTAQSFPAELPAVWLRGHLNHVEMLTSEVRV